MISFEMNASVVGSREGRNDTPCRITLSWDDSYNPLVVQMVIGGDDISEEVAWVFFRETMMRGVNSLVPFGSGDIKFRWSGESELYVCLNNPLGHADLSLPHGMVVAFLEETAEVVPVGAERLDDLIDEAIKEWFDGVA